MSSASGDCPQPQRRLSDLTVRLCGGIIFAGVCFGFASTVIILVMDLGIFWALISGATSAIVVIAAAIRLWRYHHQPDIAPDFLTKLVRGRYADAEGFCFHTIAHVQEGRLEVQVYFQNRFDRPCRARLDFTPHGFFRKGLVDFGFDVDCGPGEFGIVRIPWPIATKFAGNILHLSIRSQIDYPQGKGKVLRFRLGTPVRTGRAVARLVMPLGFEESQLVGAPTTEVLWRLGDAEGEIFPKPPGAFESTTRM